MSEAWRIVSPAPRSAALALAGARARVRKGVLHQVREYDSAAVFLGDQPVAVIMFGRHGWRRLEMALALSPGAARHMRRLVRIAQLTLRRMAETHLIVARVHPANAAGARMAMLTGFRRARLDEAGLWVFRRERDGRDFRRRRGEAGGAEKPRAAGDRQ